MKGKISAVITAFNEESKIEDCLKSVRFCDEIIFIYAESRDNTVNIVKKYKAKVFSRKNNPMLNVNKNFGFSKASNKWILSLDSDERVSDGLREEILGILENDANKINGYYIPRRNYIFGKWVKYTGWYPDFQLRLFRNGKGKFEEKHIHEMIKIDGKTDYLKSDILHLNYENISQFLKKTESYTQNEAEQLLSAGYVFDWKDCLRMPVKEFLSRFFAREGYKDGLHGLILSLLMAFYHLIIFARIWENTKFEEYSSGNFLKETGSELSKIRRELSFWFKKAKMDNIRNPINKNLQRLINKLTGN